PHGSGQNIPYKYGREIRWPTYVIGKDGRKYETEFVPGASEPKAERILQDRIAAARRKGVRLEREIPTFAEHVERWEGDVLPMYEKYSTRLGHSGNVHKHLLPRFGTWLITAIETTDVQQFFRELVEKGHGPQKKPYSPHSLHHFREVFRAVMQDAVSSHL